MHLDELDTPHLLGDLDGLEDNLDRYQAYFSEHGIGLRPHIKTHKCLAIAHMQMARGAMGITCQKLGEAEVMVTGGVARDVPEGWLGRVSKFCDNLPKAVDEVGATVHLSCFDLSPAVMDLIKSGKVQYTIDQQQRLQGYMPIIVLHLFNQNAGLLPGANIPSGPGFVDKSNASAVASQAGINR